MEMKRCCSCGEEKAHSEFYLNRGRPSGSCKACRAKQDKARKAAKSGPRKVARKEKLVLAERGLKRCGDCKAIRPKTTEFFGRSTRSEDGWLHMCKACESAYRAALWAKNREKNLAQQAQARRDAGVPERKPAQSTEERNRKARERERQRRLDPAKGEELRRMQRERFKSNREVLLQRQRDYNRRNPEKIREQNARSRARRLQVEGEYTGSDLKRILIAQDFKCFYCGDVVKNASRAWHADHFIPVARGGTNHPDNIVIACADCNLSKGKKLPWEWRPERFPPPTERFTP